MAKHGRRKRQTICSSVKVLACVFYLFFLLSFNLSFACIVNIVENGFGFSIDLGIFVFCVDGQKPACFYTHTRARSLIDTHTRSRFVLSSKTTLNIERELSAQICRRENTNSCCSFEPFFLPLSISVVAC